MTDAYDAERRKTVRLALVLSAGLHLLALSTVDLAPGSWRHGLRPALQVTLVPAPADAGQDGPPAAARPAAQAKARKAQGDAGLNAGEAQPGSTVPTTVRYYRNSEVDTPAVAVSRGPLIFPEHAYVSRLRGMVKARIYIDEQGKVVSVQIVEVKPRGGIFEEAALEALRQMRYSAALIAGQPVKTQKLVEVNFNPYDAEDKPRD